ncbi:MAG: hypothetical protein WC997_04090 [Porticoccaceae bacterium]
MRELSLNEMELVAGSGAVDTMNATITGGATGAVALTTLRGVALGSRLGIIGAVGGGIIGFAAGVYDWYQDGTDYGDGTNY